MYKFFGNTGEQAFQTFFICLAVLSVENTESWCFFATKIIIYMAFCLCSITTKNQILRNDGSILCPSMLPTRPRQNQCYRLWSSHNHSCRELISSDQDSRPISFESISMLPNTILLLCCTIVFILSKWVNLKQFVDLLFVI